MAWTAFVPRCSQNPLIDFDVVGDDGQSIHVCMKEIGNRDAAVIVAIPHYSLTSFASARELLATEAWRVVRAENE